MDVQMFHPTTLTAVIELTHLQEEKLKARRRFPQFDTNKVSPSLLPNPPKVGTPPINRLTPMEAKERRKHGLCFNCDEKFHRGHRCKTKTLFLIEGNWPDDGDNEEVIAEPEVQMVDTAEVNPEISIRAIAGATSPQTMRVHGKLKGHPVTILID